MADNIHKPASYADVEAPPPHVVGEVRLGPLATHLRPSRRQAGATRVSGTADRGDKRRLHAPTGGDHLWFLDPRARMLEVFARQGHDGLLPHTCFEAEDENAPPFDLPTFSLGLLWPFNPPSSPQPPAD